MKDLINLESSSLSCCCHSCSSSIIHKRKPFLMNQHVTKTTTLFFSFFLSVPALHFRSLVAMSLGFAGTGKMRRGSGRFDLFKGQQGRQRSIQAFVLIVFLYVVLVNVQMPFVFDSRDRDVKVGDNALPRNVILEKETASESESGMTDFMFRHSRNTLRVRAAPPLNFGGSAFYRNTNSNKMVSGLVFYFDNYSIIDQDRLHKAAKSAWDAGLKMWDDIQIQPDTVNIDNSRWVESKTDKKCPHSISISEDEFTRRGRILALPCGLTLGSHITVVGKPRLAHLESHPKIGSAGRAMVSQFVLELQGLKTAGGEEPPKILHLNTRLKGDWSGKPVIEMNTCYRMQWGTPQRCEGSQSVPHEEIVDGQVKCEKWNNTESDHSYPSTWWLDRLIGRRKADPDWPFPFAEDKLFVLTLSAGYDGYHLNVNGRHISSFPYRINFALEDVTGLWLNGDVDVRSVYTSSLPTSHPSNATQMHLEMEDKWKAPPVLDQPVELFIGILSAGSHFAERMAVRKSWMQHSLIRSSRVVARFFVALHARKEVNLELKKEAEYFGDIVIVPYIDNYDLVVLKTVAICEYGIRTLSAQTIMKCDDDTYVRVSVVNYGARKLSSESFYAGNINYHHKPLRSGKWAVTNSEWLEEDYPPYANGPGYLLSAEIAKFIVTEFDKNQLRLFKMEDVSMGMWVEQFNRTRPVKYVHSLKFCQFGCVQNYYTAHYQSPRQMMCLWAKLNHYGKPQCCNM